MTVFGYIAILGGVALLFGAALFAYSIIMDA